MEKLWEAIAKIQTRMMDLLERVIELQQTVASNKKDISENNAVLCEIKECCEDGQPKNCVLRE